MVLLFCRSLSDNARCYPVCVQCLGKVDQMNSENSLLITIARIDGLSILHPGVEPDSFIGF